MGGKIFYIAWFVVMTYDILYDMGTRETTQVVSNFNLETKDIKKGPFLVIMSCNMVWPDCWNVT